MLQRNFSSCLMMLSQNSGELPENHISETIEMAYC